MTYKLCFTLNENDNIKCYLKNSKDNYIRINLSQKRLKKLLDIFVNKYPKHQEYFKNNIEYLKFNHIKKEEADYLIQESNKYNKTVKKIQKKVKRKNKFNKQGIVCTAATIVLLAGLWATKENNDNNVSEPTIDNYVNEMVISNDENNNDELYYIDNEESDSIVEKDIIQTNEEQTDITKTENKEIESNIKEEKNDIIKLELDFDLQADMEKYNHAKENYYSTIEKYANMYGVDPQLCLALFTHERGYHSEKVDAGGAVGLCQIQVEGVWNWNEKDVTAYNFETNSYETFHITMNGENDVSKLGNNVKAGVMILQSSLRDANYHILQGIQGYNYGWRYIEKVLDACSKSTGIPINVLNKQNNSDWFQYRNVISGGDPQYIENIFKYIAQGTKLTFKTPNGETISFVYSNAQNLENNYSNKR